MVVSQLSASTVNKNGNDEQESLRIQKLWELPNESHDPLWAGFSSTFLFLAFTTSSANEHDRTHTMLIA